jgi:hypothetical protein
MALFNHNKMTRCYIQEKHSDVARLEEGLSPETQVSSRGDSGWCQGNEEDMSCFSFPEALGTFRPHPRHRHLNLDSVNDDNERTLSSFLFRSPSSHRHFHPPFVINVMWSRQITSLTPPAFIFHTSTDELVPVENSLLMIQALQDKRVSFLG